MRGGTHWKSKRGRPKKPPAPMPSIHCSRCRHLDTTQPASICSLGHDLNARTCGAFRDCSVQHASNFYAMTGP